MLQKKKNKNNDNKNAIEDPFSITNWQYRTSSLLDNSCWICGDDTSIEMHHIKHIKTINVKLSGFSKLMARMNRKQIPLCQSCHNKVHKGEYDGISLSSLHKNLKK